MKTPNSKVIFLTGGTRGIGANLTKTLTSEGHTVINTSRSLPNTQNPTKKQKKSPTTIKMDVTDHQSIKHAFQFIDDNFKPIDVLINCAGIGHFKTIEKTTLSEWNEMISVNLTGAFICSKLAFARMKKNGGGRIINIGSISDTQPIKENGGYAASKMGLRALSGILTEEGKSENIFSTHISLGAVWSDIWKEREGFQKEDMLDPDEVVSLIYQIIQKPLTMRIDHLEIFPKKGLL
jgi:NADP-dependent 3-hydroxy acid dehydrogenase YdfG